MLYNHFVNILVYKLLKVNFANIIA